MILLLALLAFCGCGQETFDEPASFCSEIGETLHCLCEDGRTWSTTVCGANYEPGQCECPAFAGPSLGDDRADDAGADERVCFDPDC